MKLRGWSRQTQEVQLVHLLNWSPGDPVVACPGHLLTWSSALPAGAAAADAQQEAGGARAARAGGGSAGLSDGSGLSPFLTGCAAVRSHGGSLENFDWLETCCWGRLCLCVQLHHRAHNGVAAAAEEVLN